MVLWAERERKRTEFLASLDDAEAAIARGEGISITEESMRKLADDISRRGRSRIAASQSLRAKRGNPFCPQTGGHPLVSAMDCRASLAMTRTPARDDGC
jgi:hypothetical protein